MTVKLLSRVHWFTSCLMINSSLFSCLLRNAQILHESPIMSIQIIHPSSGIWQLKDDCIVIFIITVQFLRGFFHRAERAVVGLSDVKKTPVVLLCVYKKIVWGFCDPCAAWAGPCRAVPCDLMRSAPPQLSVRQPLWSRVLEVLELSSCHPLCMPHTECAATVRSERTD